MKPMSLILSFLIGGNLLIATPEKKSTSVEFEEQVVVEASKVRSAPLSEALFQLLQGISDDMFGNAFFKKIKQAENDHFSGEYLDHWDNGQLKIRAFFKDGKVDGHIHGWFEDGDEAFKSFFYENTKAGIHIAFYKRENPSLTRTRTARILSYNFEGQLDGKQISDHYVSVQGG